MAAVASLVVLVFLTLSAGILHIPAVRDFALERGQGYLLEKQNIDLESGDLDYNLFRGSSTLHDVVIRAKDAPPGSPPFFTADRVEVNLGLTDLLRGRFAVEEALVVGGEIQIFYDEEGRSNVPDMGGGEETENGGGPLDFLIEDFRARGPQIQYVDREANREIAINDWSVTIRGRDDPVSHRISIDTGSAGRLVLEGTELPLRISEAEVRLSRSNLDIDAFAVRLGASNVRVEGAVRNLNDPVFDLTTRGRIELAEWGDLAGYEELQGNAQFSGTIRRRLERLLAELRVEATDLGLDPEARAEAVVNYSRADERLALPELTLTSTRGRFDGAATLFFEEGQTSTARGSFERLDTAFFSRMFDAPYVLGSRASGNLEASWPGMEFGEAQAQGRATLRAAAESPRESYLPASGSVRFNRNAAGDIEASLTNLSTLGTTVSGQASLASGGSIDANLDAAMDDLGRTIENVQTLTGAESAETAGEDRALEGPARATIAVSGTLDEPVAEVSFQSDNLRAGPIEGMAVDANAVARQSGVNFDSITVNWQDRTLRANGRLGLEGESPSLDFTASADRFPAEAIAAAAGVEDAGIAGEVSLDGTVQGTVESPQATFDVAVDGLRAYNEGFGRLTADGRLADTRVTLNQLRLEQQDAGGVVEASGTYDLESEIADLTVSARELTLDTLELPEAPPVQGRFTLDAEIAGPLDDPTADVMLAAADLVVGDFEAGAVDATAELRNQNVTWSLAAPKFGVEGTGEGPLTAPYPIDFQATLSGFEPAVLDPDLPATTLSGRVEGTVPIEDLEAADVSVELQELRVEAAKQRIVNSEPIRMSYRNRQFEVESLAIESSGAELAASGVLPLEGDSAEGLRVNGNFSLEIIRLLSGKTVDELFVLGLAEIDGVIAGSLEEPRPDVRIALEDAVVLSPATIQPIINADVVAQVGEEGVRLESAAAEWARATISASGLLPYPLIGVDFIGSGDLDQPAQLQASLEGLEIDVLEVGPTGFGGQADVQLDLQTAELKPEAVTGVLTVPQLTLRMRELTLSQTEPATIRIENGEARIESFDIEGPESEFSVDGSVQFAPEVAFDLRADVVADAGIANYLVEDVTLRGPAELHATIQGTPDEPVLDGSFTLEDGGFAIDDPAVGIEELNIRLALSRERIEVQQFSGVLNGGDLAAFGSVDLGDDFAITPDLQLEARDVFLEPIEGLRTLARFDLRLAPSEDERILLDGDFVIEDGSYRENLDLDAQIGTFLRDTDPVLVGDRNPFLEQLDFNVNVETANPMVVDNNLAEMEASLDLRLVGTYYRPALLGRAVLEEGGEVYLAENDYVIERGMVEFTNENRIRPELTLTARTEVAGHEITLQASGPIEELETQFTSDSGLPEPDIVSLLVTGRTLEEARESGVNIAREQALSFLAGSIGSRLAQSAESSLGLTEVRIEPNLISAEEDPSARLTVGQRITRQLELIYSMNLTDSGDQIFITEYDLTRRFNLRGVKQGDNTYRFDFRHDVRFGLGRERQGRDRREDKTIRNITIEGEPAMSEAEILDILGIEEGKKYDFFKLRGKIDKLEKTYRKQDYLQARVRLRRQEEGDQVDLRFVVNAGPTIQFVFFPEEPPGDVREQVREAWSQGVFETQRIDDAERAVLSWLTAERFYQAEVSTTVEELAEDARRVNINIEKGVSFNELEVRFPGAEGIPPEELRQVLDALDLTQRLRARGRETSESLERYYAQKGFLDAEVEQPDMELDADTRSAIATVAIDEGPQYRVGETSFEGVESLDLQTLERTLAVEAGNPVYTPEYLDTALETIEEYYWNRGFNDVLVNFLLTRHPEEAQVDIVFQIDEGKQDIVRELEISGNRYVSDAFIRRRLTFSEGQGLTPDVAGRSRRRLYDTRAFALVDFNKEPIDVPGAPPTENSLKVNLGIREVSPYRIRYGGFYDTDRGPGAIVDIENRNVLGSARWVGFRGRYDQDLREGRLYFSQPLLSGLPIETTSAVYRSREFRDLFITDRTGVSVQQEVEFRRRFIWNYGYRYERARTFERNPDPLFPFDVTVNVAPLTSSLTFDTRDSLLDATRGRFTSHGFEYAPDAFGSDVRFIKYFGQYFDYYSLIDSKPRPFETKPRKPRLLYAGGVRLGMAKGLGGQDIVVSERFFAGGGTTVRGFEQDELGPKDPFGNPLGGDAVFIVNNELRFPIVSVFEGVSFVDVGNVYETAADFDPFDVRSTAGLGVRLRTPFFLLRFDYGWKLDRQPNESSGAFFFSIGQAF